ncbi:alanine racemase [Myxococcota bacterium]|nr:alanine racemase [Myxococcota bacterium]
MSDALVARWRRYSAALAAEAPPAALVDVALFDANVARTLTLVAPSKKRLRVASKSIRSIPLLSRVRALTGDVMIGVMSYAVREAAHLVAHGFHDVLVAYPTVHPKNLALLAELAARPGVSVSIVADSEVHVAALEDAARVKGVRIPVLVDLDVSLRALGGALHLGVRRSPIHDVDAVLALAERIARSRHLVLDGVMAYEAQIAGVTDASPFTPLMDPAKRMMKELSRTPVERTRDAIARGFTRRGLPLRVFNGGGTGSLAWCVHEPALTEVTVGSAFLDGHLFDYYQDVKWEPAACFALEVVRVPGPGLVTCHGGGYVASGEAGRDRLPRPYLPPGLALVDLEGAGEVQTPLRVGGSDVALAPGALVFLRHAKAGELAEHFDEYLLVDVDRVVGRATTYRGEGQRFL